MAYQSAALRDPSCCRRRPCHDAKANKKITQASRMLTDDQRTSDGRKAANHAVRYATTLPKRARAVR
jgi:hypothetical protein